MRPEWRNFTGGAWETEVDVRDFIQKNYEPYANHNPCVRL